MYISTYVGICFNFLCSLVESHRIMFCLSLGSPSFCRPHESLDLSCSCRNTPPPPGTELCWARDMWAPGIFVNRWLDFLDGWLVLHAVAPIQLSCFNKASHRLRVAWFTFRRVYITAGSQNAGHFASQGTRGQVCKHVGDAFWEQPSMLLTHPTMPTGVPHRTISPNAQCWVGRQLYVQSPSWWMCFFSPQSMIPTIK